MKRAAGSEKFLFRFMPDQMDSVQRFGLFKYSPLENNRYFRGGIKVTSDHLEKFRVLAEIANEIAPGFDIDRAEVDEKGYSPAKYSRQYSAVMECCINELYAALDGIRDIVYSVYSNVPGVQKKSTSKLFSRAKNNEYGEGFPDVLKIIFSDAYDLWFQRLRKYRTEFTHGSLSHCTKNQDTDQIIYVHPGMGDGNKSLIIDDFIGYVNSVYKACLDLQEKVFDYLFGVTPLEPVKTMCGIYKGRIYMREIKPEIPLTRDSGVCASSHYEVKCPLESECGALKNKHYK